MLFENFKEETLCNYEDRIFFFINKYEHIKNNILEYLDRVIILVINVYEKIIFGLIYLFSLTGLVMRYSTFPMHWIWIKLILRNMYNDEDKPPILQTGTHYITGLPEAGKSTFAYAAMMDYAYRTGKCSYTTEQMETARTDLFGHKYFYHQVFSPDEFFQDGEQVVSFDNKRFNMVVYDEMLTKYQQRNNKSRSYNNEVLPMIAAMGTQRHQKIDLFFFISQLPRNDISIMQMLRMYHEPQIKKSFNYKLWLRTGQFKFRIKGWNVTTYSIQVTSGNDYKLVKKFNWFYENQFDEDFKYYNRLNMSEKYSKLPTHKGQEMIG